MNQHGAVADHLQVERSFERAVDALLSDLLQHVIVDHTSDVEGALALAAEHGAGHCGFVVLDDVASRPAPLAVTVPAAARSLSSVATATGPYADALSRVVGEALIVRSFDVAAVLAPSVTVPVATMAGEVFRGGGLVEGGSHQDARGILETRGEAERLREQVTIAAAELDRMTIDAASLDALVIETETAIAAAVESQHHHEKAVVLFDAQLARAAEELARADTPARRRPHRAGPCRGRRASGGTAPRGIDRRDRDARDRAARRRRQAR